MTSSYHPSPSEPVREEPTSSTAKNDEVLHEYDGIQEYDNPLPGWWVWTFWATFVFALGYVGYYLTGNGTSVANAYEDEMRVAREERAKASLAETPSEASLSPLMADVALMQDAKQAFGLRCGACHGNEGQGLIGPNLTDDHWVHGEGTLMDIYAVVAHGVPAKGMPAWELQLQPIQLRKLVAFVGTLRGTNVAGRAPEGRAVSKH